VFDTSRLVSFYCTTESVGLQGGTKGKLKTAPQEQIEAGKQLKEIPDRNTMSPLRSVFAILLRKCLRKAGALNLRYEHLDKTLFLPFNRG